MGILETAFVLDGNTWNCMQIMVIYQAFAYM